MDYYSQQFDGQDVQYYQLYVLSWILIFVTNICEMYFMLETTLSADFAIHHLLKM